jgi:SulP family sulfate permease
MVSPVERVADPDGTSCVYVVRGELFFASDQEFIDSFEFALDPPNVIIDMSRETLSGQLEAAH